MRVRERSKWAAKDYINVQENISPFKKLYQRSGEYISVQKFISTLKRIYQRSANYPLKPHKKIPKSRSSRGHNYQTQTQTQTHILTTLTTPQLLKQPNSLTIRSNIHLQSRRLLRQPGHRHDVARQAHQKASTKFRHNLTYRHRKAFRPAEQFRLVG